jgi:ketosteroid isomerase-like protein
MSQETATVVRRWFDRLQAGDPGADMCHPEIEIRNWPESPVPGPYFGRDGVRKWFREVNDSDIGSEIRMFALQEVIEAGEDRVLTIQRARGRGRTSQLEVDRLWGSIVTVRSGQIASAFGYSTPEEARQAAGLQP